MAHPPTPIERDGRHDRRYRRDAQPLQPAVPAHRGRRRERPDDRHPRRGRLWRRVAALEDESRDIQYPCFPAPGLFWIWEIAIGTNPKIVRPSNIRTSRPVGSSGSAGEPASSIAAWDALAVVRGGLGRRAAARVRPPPRPPAHRRRCRPDARPATSRSSRAGRLSAYDDPRSATSPRPSATPISSSTTTGSRRSRASPSRVLRTTPRTRRGSSTGRRPRLYDGRERRQSRRDWYIQDLIVCVRRPGGEALARSEPCC